MRPSLSPRHVAGWLIVLVALAFSSHGVRVVRGADGALGTPSPVLAEGPVCQPGAPATLATDWSEIRRLLRERQRARGTPDPSERVIVLNGSGYNSGPPSQTPR